MSSDPVPVVAAVRASPRPPVTGIWAWVVQRRRWIWLMLSSAGLVLAVQEVVGSRAELLSAIGDLRRVSWTWLGVAILAEWCSYTAVAFAQRRLLRAGGVTVRVGTLGRLAVASQAMGSVLPVGYLVSNVVVLGGLTRRGVGKMLALWMLAMVGLLYIVTLVLIGLVGAQLAPPSKDVPDLRVVAAIVLGVVIGGFVAVVAVNRMRRRPWSMRELAARMPGGGRIKRLIGGDVLAELSLGPRGWSVGFGWMLLYWAGDVACLAVAFFAVGGILPWRGLLLAYAAGQLAALLPITPGGLGLTEGSMSLALAAYTGATTALAAVLLYRLITYWAVLPAGGTCYLWLRRRRSELAPFVMSGRVVHGGVRPMPEKGVRSGAPARAAM